MRRVEVRCCCSPLKLLGTLPLPDKVQAHTYAVMQPKTTDFLRVAARGVRPQTVTLQLVQWAAPDGKFRMVPQGYALKADGIPIEVLRRIPGFIEADEVSQLPKEVT